MSNVLMSHSLIFLSGILLGMGIGGALIFTLGAIIAAAESDPDR